MKRVVWSGYVEIHWGKGIGNTARVVVGESDHADVGVWPELAQPDVLGAPSWRPATGDQVAAILSAAVVGLARRQDAEVLLRAMNDQARAEYRSALDNNASAKIATTEAAFGAISACLRAVVDGHLPRSGPNEGPRVDADELRRRQGGEGSDR